MFTSSSDLIFGNDNLLLLSLGSSLLIGLALLTACMALHVFGQRSGVAGLAAARQHNLESESQQFDLQAAYAHDLRTPITRMTLRCEFIADAAMREAMLRDLAEMSELIDACIAGARARRDAAATLRQIDADGLLAALVDNYREAGSAVQLEGAVGQPVVACPQALRRVLVNLIDNALRYGKDVRLCVRVDARRLVFAVLDSGPGIVPTELEAVFAPWYRAPETSTRVPGSGLGLAIARRLALGMRGELQLQNRHSGGLEARLTLPLAAA